MAKKSKPRWVDGPTTSILMGTPDGFDVDVVRTNKGWFPRLNLEQTEPFSDREEAKKMAISLPLKEATERVKELRELKKVLSEDSKKPEKKVATTKESEEIEPEPEETEPEETETETEETEVEEVEEVEEEEVEEVEEEEVKEAPKKASKGKGKAKSTAKKEKSAKEPEAETEESVDDDFAEFDDELED